MLLVLRYLKVKAWLFIHIIIALVCGLGWYLLVEAIKTYESPTRIVGSDDKSKLLANHQKGCSDVSKDLVLEDMECSRVPLFQPCRWDGEQLQNRCPYIIITNVILLY